MNQTLDILSGPVERLADRRLDHGHHRARRWTQDRRDRRNDVDRVERQNRCVFVVESSVVTSGAVNERVCGEVPVYEERLVAVVLLFVDVLRRSGGKPPDRDEKDKPDEPASEHCGHPMLRRQMQQLKSP